MKTILRKTLSLFLAFAMLAAVLPAATPAAEATGADVVESFTFDWTMSGSGLTETKYLFSWSPSDTTLQAGNIACSSNEELQRWQNLYNYTDARNWAFVKAGGGIRAQLWAISGYEAARHQQGLILGKSGASTGWAAFKVNVPKGTYSVSAEVYTNSAALLNVYMMPYTAALAEDPSQLFNSTNSATSKVGSADTSSTGTGVANTTSGRVVEISEGYTFNTAGEYIIVLQIDSSAGSGYIRSLTFNREVMRTYSWKAAGKYGGHSDAGASWNDETTFAQYKAYNADVNRYWAYLDGVVTQYSSNPFSQGYYCQFIQSRKLYNYVAFKINVPEAGSYDAEFNKVNSAYGGVVDLYMLPYSAQAAADPAAYALDKYKIASGIDCYQADATVSDTPTTGWNGTVNFAEAGDYIFIVEFAGENNPYNDYYYIGLSDLIIKKTGEAAAEETQDVSGADILGEYYAYINGGILNLYGGVKKLAGYTKVGFEIKADGGDWTAISEGTSNVYSALTGKDGRSVGVTAFGDDCKYVFTDSTALAVSGEVSIRAYAVPVEGETVYGYEYTVTIE